MAKFSDVLRNIFFLLLLLQFAPPLIKSIKKQYSRILEQHTQVAFLPIKGQINNASYYVKYLKKYFEDHEIKAIVLKIDSPGGAAGSSESIAQEISYLKKDNPKPIITITENICASGAYYIAVTTDYIIASPSAIIGSVGSCIPFQFKLNDFIEQFKIHYIPIKSGEYKLATDPFTANTPEQNALLQSVAQDSYNNFVEHVAKHRSKLTMEQSSTWANGKIFTGRQAVAQGLIDEVGSRSQAIKKIKDLAIIPGQIEWVRPPQAGGFWNLFSNQEGPEDDNPLNSMINWIRVQIEHYYRQQSIS